MKKLILDYFNSQKPGLIVQAPARINLINPLDAVEGDFWMPASAIEGDFNPLSVFLYIKQKYNSSLVKVFHLEDQQGDKKVITILLERRLITDINKIKKEFDGDLKLIYASLYRIYLTSKSLWNRIKNSNIEIGIISTIPRQSGLGGSASIIIALIYGLAKYFNLYNDLKCLQENEFPLNKDIIAEMATKVEDEDLNITAGYSDRYVISRGGLSFCSYYKKLWHKSINEEPIAVYDRIDKTYQINKLPIIICFSGASHDSGDIHKKLRRLYLNNNLDILKCYEKLSEIAWRSRFALMKKDWRRLGEFFKENTQIMNEVMKVAGFKYGIGLANNILIKIVEDLSGVYAAKLTGAGGGGSVFALVKPGVINKVLVEWKNKLIDLIQDKNQFQKKFSHYPLEVREKLKNAKFFKIRINKTGVKKIY